MKQYLLTGETWIPVLRRGGESADVSLLELFGDGRRIADLSLPPAQRIALMRFLLCIIVRSLPLPRTRKELKSVRERISPQAVDYLKRWEAAFDLYGKHPFLQAVGLEKESNATLDKLDFTLSSGSNHTLFDHLATEAGRPHPPAWQARMLLVTQNFSPGGTIGPNQWNGVVTNSLTGNISSPALEGSPLHTFLQGDDILETLHLNLIPQEELGEMAIGEPVWENPPENAADAQKFRATLLGRLAPVSRAVKLPEEGEAVSLAVGCNYAQLPEIIDPYLAHRNNEKENTKSYLRVQPDRHPWRELESLLALQPKSSNAVTPPQNLRVSAVPPEKQLRLWCGGVAVDKAKYEFAGEWLFTFQADMFMTDDFWNQFGKFVQDAEAVAVLLKASIGVFWKNLSEIISSESVKIKAGKNKAETQALMGYWKRLDAEVTEFISGWDGDFSPLYAQLRKMAETFFTGSLPDNSPRGMMALARTMPYFRKELNRIVGKIEAKGENKDGK